jgi:hypothetical protein
VLTIDTDIETDHRSRLLGGEQRNFERIALWLLCTSTKLDMPAKPHRRDNR